MARYEQSDDEAGRVSFMLPGVSPEVYKARSIRTDNDLEEENGSRTEGPFVSFFKEDDLLTSTSQ